MFTFVGKIVCDEAVMKAQNRVIYIPLEMFDPEKLADVFKRGGSDDPVEVFLPESFAKAIGLSLPE